MPETLSLVDQIDPGTCVIYLLVNGEDVVKLQAFFELYEGVAIVRTLSIRESLVAVITTPSMLNDCIKILEEIKQETPWTALARPKEAAEQLIQGYFSTRIRT